jgi:hypothetical protein
MQKKPVKGERDGVEIESSSECALSKRHYVVVASIDVAIHIRYVMTVFGMLCLYQVCYFHIWYVIPTTVSRFTQQEFQYLNSTAVIAKFKLIGSQGTR